jgi:hypothetical protein
LSEAKEILADLESLEDEFNEQLDEFESAGLGEGYEEDEELSSLSPDENDPDFEAEEEEDLFELDEDEEELEDDEEGHY